MRGQAFFERLIEYKVGALTSVDIATPVSPSCCIIPVMELMQEKLITRRSKLTLCITEFSDFHFSLMDPFDGHHRANSLQDVGSE